MNRRQFISLSTLAAGCGGSSDQAEFTITPSQVRAQRRAYDGAPPVIPHPPLGASCTSCHTAAGMTVPTRGFAPANPHVGSDNQVGTANCRQCHLISGTADLFAENTFVGLAQRVDGGSRM